MRERHRKIRDILATLDIIYVILGISVVGMFITIFVSPEKYEMLFPFIFFLSGILNFISSFTYFSRAYKGKRQILLGLTTGVFGLVLFVVCIMSVVSLV